MVSLISDFLSGFWILDCNFFNFVLKLWFFFIFDIVVSILFYLFSFCITIKEIINQQKLDRRGKLIGLSLGNETLYFIISTQQITFVMIKIKKPKEKSNKKQTKNYIRKRDYQKQKKAKL